MIQEILNGISVALDTAFPKMQIYPEEVENDMVKPCFIINTLDPYIKDRLCGSTSYDITYVVQYFPEKLEDKYSEMYGVMETLKDALGIITVEYNESAGLSRKCRARDIQFTIAGDVLNCKCRYADYFYEKDESEYMKTVTKTVTEKG